MREKKKQSLKGQSLLLYEKLLEIAESLPPGAPMPPVNLLKKNFCAGYAVLNRVIRALEADGKLTVRPRKGVFAAGSARAVQAEPQKDGAGIFSGMMSSGAPALSLAVLSKSEDKTWAALAEAYNAQGGSSRVEPHYFDETGLREIAAEPESLDLCASSHLTGPDVLPPKNFADLAPLLSGFTSGLKLRENIFARPEGEPRKISAVSPFQGVMVMACNKEAFKKAGAKLAQYPSPDEMLEVCRKMEKDFAPGNVFVFLGYMPWFFRFGAQLSARGGKIVFDAEKSAAVIDFLEKVSVTNKLSPFCSESYSIYNQPGSLLSRRPAFAEVIPGALAGAEDYAFAPMPMSPEGKAPVVRAELRVSAGTLFPEECADFIRFTFSEQGQRIIARHSNCLPSAVDIKPENMPPDMVSAMELSAARGETVYEGSLEIFETRFITEMLAERCLKGGMKRADLKNEIESRCGRMRKTR